MAAHCQQDTFVDKREPYLNHGSLGSQQQVASCPASGLEVHSYAAHGLADHTSSTLQASYGYPAAYVAKKP